MATDNMNNIDFFSTWVFDEKNVNNTSKNTTDNFNINRNSHDDPNSAELAYLNSVAEHLAKNEGNISSSVTTSTAANETSSYINYDNNNLSYVNNNSNNLTINTGNNFFTPEGTHSLLHFDGVFSPTGTSTTSTSLNSPQNGYDYFNNSATFNTGINFSNSMNPANISGNTMVDNDNQLDLTSKPMAFSRSEPVKLESLTPPLPRGKIIDTNIVGTNNVLGDANFGYRLTSDNNNQTTDNEKQINANGSGTNSLSEKKNVFPATKNLFVHTKVPCGSATDPNTKSNNNKTNNTHQPKVKLESNERNKFILSLYDRRKSSSSINSLSSTTNTPISSTPSITSTSTKTAGNLSKTCTNSSTSTPSTRKRLTTYQKEAHNRIEKRYRININTKIAKLQQIIPWVACNDTAFEVSQNMKRINSENGTSSNSTPKLNKSIILEKAVDYILYLQNSQSVHQLEINKLRDENKLLNERIKQFTTTTTEMGDNRTYGNELGSVNTSLQNTLN